MANYENPYSESSFFSFLWTFICRLWELCCGTASWKEIATDEVQIFVLSGIAASGALIGTFLVLRKMTMLANALSHTILLGIVAAYLLMVAFGRLEDPHQGLDIPILLISSLMAGLFTTFLTEILHRQLKLQEDASIGLVFTTLFAAGIVIVTLFTRDVHVGTELVMGNVDALQKQDIQGVLGVFIFNALMFIIFFKGFKITTFDSGLSRALGFSPLLFNYLLMILTSATAVSAFRAVGVLMVLAFFVLPPLTARFFTDRLILLLVFAIGIGSLGALIGVAFSRHLLTTYQIGFSTSGIVVCTLFVFFIAAFALSPKKGLFARWRRRQIIKSQLSEMI